MMITKEQQRKFLKKRISAFDNKLKAGQAITKTLFLQEEYINAKSIFVYLNTHDEAPTGDILENCFKGGKRVFVPITREIMTISEIFFDSEMEKKKYNILEPRTNIKPDIEIDLVIIPLVGFDKYKNRLGHGKGYYDRFLAMYKGNKIALAFSCQELDKIITDEYDIKMGKIITEKQIF